MPLSLLDYHSLEDGELNRLWYEENDPRARDAFRTRWWLGGDPIAGKDLLAEYHNLFLHRCLDRGILAEEHQLKTFRRMVTLFTKEFPADPIPKLEEVLLPFIDRAINEMCTKVMPPPARTADEERAAVNAALTAIGDGGGAIRTWLDKGVETLSDDEAETLLEAGKEFLSKLDGDTVARNHPLVRTPEPPPSKLDESVAVPHFKAKPLFQYAFQGGTLSKREDDHIEWCQPCRQRCLGALLLIRRLRTALGGDVAAYPNISPEFDQFLQEENPEIPQVDLSRRSVQASSSMKRGLLMTFAVVALLIGVAAVASQFKPS